MKLFFITLFLFSVNAFASLDCQSTDKIGYRLTIVDKFMSHAILTVQYKGRTIYQNLLIGKIEPNGWTYTSTPFTNGNIARAQLNINAFYAFTTIQGEFREESHLPVIPYMKLVCKEF